MAKREVEEIFTNSYLIQDDMEEDPDNDQLTAENTDDSNHDGDSKMGAPLREQDRFLPIANVAKIMKRAIPETGKIAKDARECVQECVSEFISFITSEASERCHMEKRKTINGEDILFAMNQLGFDNYIEPLKIYLQKYRDAAKCDRNLKPSDMLYEEGEENYNAPASSSIITDTTSSSSEAVIYAYQDNNQLHQFQIG